MGAATRISASAIRVEPGDWASVELTVRNTATVADQMTFEILGDASPWSRVEPSSVSLYPGAEATVDVVFTPPRLPTIPPGPTRFAVAVTPREDPEDSSLEEGILLVAAYHDVSVELNPRISRGKRRAVHEVAVDNRSNVPYRPEIAAADRNLALNFTAVPGSLDVAPGMAAFAKLLVRPVRKFWRGPAQTHAFEVVLSPEGGPFDEGPDLDGAGFDAADFEGDTATGFDTATGLEPGMGRGATPAAPEFGARPEFSAGPELPGPADPEADTPPAGIRAVTETDLEAGRPGGTPQPATTPPATTPPAAPPLAAPPLAPPPLAAPPPLPPGTGIRFAGPGPGPARVEEIRRAKQRFAPTVTADGSFVQEALAPKWLTGAIAALVAIAVVVAALWLALVRPQIRTAAKNQVSQQLAAAGVTSTAPQATTSPATNPAPTTVAQAPTTPPTSASATSPTAATPAVPSGQPINGRLDGHGNGTVSYTVPKGRTFQLTDLILENPGGDTGLLELARDGTILMQISMANFRDLDYHLVAPIVLRGGQELQLVVGSCTDVCQPGVFYSGYLATTPDKKPAKHSKHQAGADAHP